MTQELLGRVHRELLDVLNSINQDEIHHDGDDFHELLNDVEKALAQPEQEPVAWMDADGNISDNNDHKCFPIPLYTHPPQRTWVDVPDEEIKRLWIQYRAALPRYLCFAKDLLSRSKEKNT